MDRASFSSRLRRSSRFNGLRGSIARLPLGPKFQRKIWPSGGQSDARLDLPRSFIDSGWTVSMEVVLQALEQTVNARKAGAAAGVALASRRNLSQNYDSFPISSRVPTSSFQYNFIRAYQAQ